MVARVSAWRGTKMNPWEKPWRKRGHARVQKAVVGVTRVMKKRAEAGSEQPPANIIHWSMGERAGDHESRHGAEPDRSEGEPGRPRVVAEDGLRVESEEKETRVESEPDEKDGESADAEVAVGEHAEVEDRFRGHQLPEHEGD